MDTTKLEMKVVGGIKGIFLIPSYQRGYRWGKNEVERLLTDIHQNGDQQYCLQPITVIKDGNSYRVIDGQQRLTTIYLIYKYLHDIGGHQFEPPKFALSYETRLQSAQFLAASYQEMIARQNENIDYWFIQNAYSTIDQWFSDDSHNLKSDLASTISRRLNQSVNFIWHEIGQTADEKKLFTSLNISKIPLTNAELTRAMFLGDATPGLTREYKKQIARKWDDIKKSLSRASFWYFLTNANAAKSPTKIDFLLDLISGKPTKSEPYCTFFYFDQQKRLESPAKIWHDIERLFTTLQDWYEDHELYHKIGYLISTSSCTLRELYDDYQEQAKSAFKKSLDQKIKSSINTGDKTLADLTYDSDYQIIQNLLLLFNVESARQNTKAIIWFPFDKFKTEHWILDYLHAYDDEYIQTITNLAQPRPWSEADRRPYLTHIKQVLKPYLSTKESTNAV